MGHRSRTGSSTSVAVDAAGGGVSKQVPYKPVSAAQANSIDIIPARYFLDKDKPHNIYLIDVSPSSSVVASKHGNNVIKIWSLMLGSLQTSIKFSSYVNAQVRSREYFIRSHAVLSESATLIGITAGFGQSLEVWNWTKLQAPAGYRRGASVGCDAGRCLPQQLAARSRVQGFVVGAYPISSA